MANIIITVEWLKLLVKQVMGVKLLQSKFYPIKPSNMTATTITTNIITITDVMLISVTPYSYIS